MQTIIQDISVNEIDIKQYLGKKILFITTLGNKRNVARVLFPAQDDNFLIIKAQNSNRCDIIHYSDIISIIA